MTTNVKIVVLGDGGVGKTAPTLRLSLNFFVEVSEPLSLVSLYTALPGNRVDCKTDQARDRMQTYDPTIGSSQLDE